MGSGWLLNREENLRWIVAYQAEKVPGKLHTVRPDEQLTRRLDAGILDGSSFRRLARLSSNNLLVFCNLRPSNSKENKIGMSST